MLARMKRIFISLAAFVFLANIAFIGCGPPKPTPDQLNQLTAAKTQANAAEQAASDCDNQKSELDKQLAAKQQELRQKESKRDATKRRLEDNRAKRAQGGGL